MEHGAQKLINMAWDLEKDGRIEILRQEPTQWPSDIAAAASPPPTAGPKAPSAPSPASPQEPEATAPEGDSGDG